MEILYINANEQANIADSCMALGYFDGLHLGHQELLHTVSKIAESKGLKKALMTFDKHPRELIRNEVNPHLSTLDDKIKILESYAFDYLLIVHFDQNFLTLSPQQFIQQYIINFCVKHVVCGFDYRFGYLGVGNVALLQKKYKQQFGVTVVDAQMYKEHKVSSTYIKSLLHQGDVPLANTLLGRKYNITGEVIHGYKRGKKELGFATANTVSENYVIPKTGVYGVMVQVKSEMYYGMANIGYNPTFGSLDKPSLEVHLFAFDNDIYGEVITVFFEMHLRGEVRFSSKKELIVQLEKDKQMIKAYFNIAN